MCCPYFIYSRLGLVLLNKWSSSRLEMNWIRQLERKLTLPTSWSLHWEAAVGCSARRRQGEGASLFHTMPPTLPGGQEARKVCGQATGMTSGALVGRGNHGTGTLQTEKETPGLARSSEVTASRSRASGPKVTLAAPGLAGGGHRGLGGGQKRLWIPTAGRIYFIRIVCRIGHGIISTRHPALPSFQILKSTQITFWLIWKTSFGKDLITLWKIAQPLTYSRIIKKELNAYMHMYARTHTHTSLTHTPKSCSELQGCELHRMVSGAPSPDLSLKLFMDVRKPDWIRNFLSSFSLVHLQCTSSWHFQSCLPLTKTISCFALKKWITWNGNLAAKPWKIVPGPNICPKWAQLRSPWRSRRGAWAERAWKRETKTMERLPLLMSEVLCDRGIKQYSSLTQPLTPERHTGCAHRCTPGLYPVSNIWYHWGDPSQSAKKPHPLACIHYTQRMVYMLSFELLNKNWVLGIPESWAPQGKQRGESCRLVFTFLLGHLKSSSGGSLLSQS